MPAAKDRCAADTRACSGQPAGQPGFLLGNSWDGSLSLSLPSQCPAQLGCVLPFLLAASFALTCVLLQKLLIYQKSAGPPHSGLPLCL